jgi:TPR repeat protein
MEATTVTDHTNKDRTSIRAAACRLAVVMFLISGCSVTPLRPVAYQDANVEAWFSSRTNKLVNTDKIAYENAVYAYDAQKYEEAIAAFRQLAHDGVGEAAFELGNAYRTGTSVPVDPALAAHWMMAAMSKPHSRSPHASFYLGTMFLEGEGVPRDATLAKRLLEQASRSGYVRANLPLARVYAEGIGVPADIAQAEKLARASAEAGDPASYLWLLRGYQPGGILGENRVRATEMSEKVIPILQNRIRQERDPGAMRDLAAIYYEGLGRPKDTQTGLHWLTQAAQAGEPKYLVNLGEDILKGTDGQDANPDQGFKILESAAQQFRHPEAMELVADAYRDGIGTERDLKKAEEWYQQAAEAGSIKAALDYGRMLVDRRDDSASMQRGVKYLEKAAKYGEPFAWAKLGEMHVDQAFPGADPAKGVTYLQRAHDAGIPSATSELGQVYLEGRGASADPAKAEALLKQAAEQGQSGAVITLGQAYLHGAVAPSQAGEAQQWLKKSAALGHAGAMRQLGRMYLEGHGVEPNPMEGMAWLQRAVEKGDPDAAETLGSAYLWGQYGLDRDPMTGWQLLEKSAAADNPAAQRVLGHTLIDPRDSGISPNPSRGIQLLRQSADSGDGYAMELLGIAYLDGVNGMKPRPDEAKMWLERAAQTGDVSSMTKLGTAYVDGSVLKRRVRTGMKYLEQAAAQGDDTARTALGRIYLYGIEDIPPQPKRGEALLKRSIAHGDAGAKAALGRAYVTGALGERRVDEGARYLFEAARSGHPSARLVLAEAFLESQGLEGVNRDYAQAWLDTVVGSDTSAALETLTEMLREAKTSVPDDGSGLATGKNKSRK